MKVRLLFACAFACGCGRLGFDSIPTDSIPTGGDGGVACIVGQPVPLDPAGLISDAGFAYRAAGPIGSFGGPADTASNFVVSTLRLFEGDVELGPAHASHVDIRTLGLGRFSHWTETLPGDVDTLRFAASDNTDPRSNQRTYTYCAQ